MIRHIPLFVSHSAKNLSSAFVIARWHSSIGMQYLQQNITKSSATLNYCLPYSMDSLFQYRSRCALQDEFLHLLEFSFTSGFESARVVKDEIWVASKHQFILNFMVSALIKVNSCQYRLIECVGTYIKGGLHDGGIDL